MSEQTQEEGAMTADLDATPAIKVVDWIDDDEAEGKTESVGWLAPGEEHAAGARHEGRRAMGPEPTEPEYDEDYYWQTWVKPTADEFVRMVNESGVLPDGVTICFAEYPNV